MNQIQLIKQILKLSAAYFSEVDRLLFELKALRNGKQCQDQRIDGTVQSFLSLFSRKLMLKEIFINEEIENQSTDLNPVIQKLKLVSNRIFGGDSNFENKPKETNIQNKSCSLSLNPSKKKFKNQANLTQEVKKPLSPFFLYCRDRRECIRNILGIRAESEIIKIVSREWNCLSPSKKLKYGEEFNSMKNKYNQYLLSLKNGSDSRETEAEETQQHIYSNSDKENCDFSEDSKEEINRKILKSMLENPRICMSDISDLMKPQNIFQVKIEDDAR